LKTFENNINKPEVGIMVDEYEKVSLSEKAADKKAGIIHNILLQIQVI